MNKPTDDPKWKQSMDEWSIHEEWSDILYRYVVEGLPPGGFFTSVLANDLTVAMCRSHVMNSVESIAAVCKWLRNDAPTRCSGSYDAVDAWIALPQEERRRICETKQILSTEQEIMWGIMRKKSSANNV